MHAKRITKEHIAESYIHLADRARPDVAFIVLVAMASAICAIGFNMNSPSVIVGAMVISPLLYSVVAIGAASLKRDANVFLRGSGTLIVGIGIAIIVAAIVSTFLPVAARSEIIDRLTSSLSDYFLVAFFSGLAGTFAFFWPDIIEAIAGIAISVALVPPLVLVGVGLAHFDMMLIIGAGAIALVNIIGIYLGSFFMSAGLHLAATKRE